VTAKKIPPVDPRVARRVPIISVQALSPGGALPDTRDRLTTKGKLHARLFAQTGHDLRTLMCSCAHAFGQERRANCRLHRLEPESAW
jgi:hypothetical protein